ncbi:T9SS type A sorting domain-containing protein [Aquimarina algiphila]|uniref:T9SS type A sorting domain-containing protein n=1 Tax=Aquimarina algiphila TaxID=2047982 RepID=UPI00232FC02F|nr:T9SS type A sorting domain-containing protein [Aquimarina algiphila]
MKNIVICLIMLIALQNLNSQEILDLPPNLEPSITEGDVDLALDKLHNYLEHIHNYKRIKKIYEGSFEFSEARWGKGTWGNGKFDNIIKKMYQNERYEDAYNEWYGLGVDNGCRPQVRDIGNIVKGYISIYGKGIANDENILNYIKWGVEKLLTEQMPPSENIEIGLVKGDYGFMSWRDRPSKNEVNRDDFQNISGEKNRPEQYDSGIAIDALKEAYYFFKKHNYYPDLVPKIYTAIEQSAWWFSTQMIDNLHIMRSDGSVKGKSLTRNTNQNAFSIWGLINAYKITKKQEHLEKAIDGYEKTINFHQKDDGAWFYKFNDPKDTLQIKEEFHDSQGQYMGVILKVIILLYDITPCYYTSKFEGQGIGYSKKNLKKKILLTINHFLKDGLVKDYANISPKRLHINGEINDYKDYEHAADIDSAIELFDAFDNLLSSELYNELSAADQNKIKRIHGVLAKPRLEQINNNKLPKPFLVFENLATFKKRKFNENNTARNNEVILCSSLGDHIGQNKIGTYDLLGNEQIGYSNSSHPFDLMTTGDFDKDGEDEIALYRKSDGRISIYNSGYIAYTGCSPVHIKSIETGFKLHDHMEALDYDGDGYKDEIVMHNKYYSGNTNRIDILDINGYISSKYSNVGSQFDLMTTGDFDDDNEDEIAFYRSDDGKITVYNPQYANQSGGYTGSSPVHAGTIVTGFTLHDNMSAMDYNNDGKDEIVMHNKQYAGKTNRIDILDLNGYISSSFSNSSDIFDLMATGDIDNDGRDELAFYTKNNKGVTIYNPEHIITEGGYTQNSPIYEGRIETNISNYNLFSILNHNEISSSSKSNDLEEGNRVFEISNTENNKLEVFPNPFHDKSNINLTLTKKGKIELSLFDALGTKKETVINQNKAAGIHKYQLNNTLSKGLYFLVLKINGEYIESIKLIKK